MYSDKVESRCAYCFFSEKAKGLDSHIHCSKRGEYRALGSAVCSEYLYDITKRPVRRRRAIDTKKEYNFEI